MTSSSSTSNAIGTTLAALLVIFVVAVLVMSRQLTTQTDAKQGERVFENGIPKTVPVQIKLKSDKEATFKDLKNAKWLGQFELEFTNTSDKPIYFVLIHMITDVRYQGQRIVFPIHYGRPELGDIISLPTSNDVPIKPGETHIFKLNEDPSWERSVREGRWVEATKFRAELQSLSFGDGTGYFGTEPYPEVKDRKKPEELSKKTRARPRAPANQVSSSKARAANGPASDSPDFSLSSPATEGNATKTPLDVSCFLPECIKVIPQNAYVCWENDPQQFPNCEFQNRPIPASNGTCRELVYDTVTCHAGSELYLCQTITLYACGFGPGPTPTPTPTPSPQPCQYCTDPNAIGPADCSDPFHPKCTGLYQYAEFGCCYQQTCQHAGVPTPTPPLPCPDGYGRPSEQLQPFPDCKYQDCIPLPPEQIHTSNACQALGFYWNFAGGQCYPEPQSCAGHCSPYWPLESGGCESAIDYCGFQWGCPYGFTDGGSGCCCGPTPILIDVAGNGFSLTNAYDGVYFDMGGDGHHEPIAWTSPGSDDAWLVLDRNDNGVIDSGKELFGNFTDQPHASTKRNGFVALAEFDRTDHGGNGDEAITSRDTVFSRLRFWQDVNHDGISQNVELYTLPSLGIAALDLKYKESKKQDRNGNRFALRTKVKDIHGAQAGRWAWDVTLGVNPPPRH